MSVPNLLVFATGGKGPGEGGSGFRELCRNRENGVLRANIVGVVSNYENGGVRDYAKQFGIPFFHFQKPYTAAGYADLVEKTKADFAALSGWLKFVCGIDMARVFNIHPAPQKFGGPGMHGSHAHEAVMEAYKRREITHSQACMFFVDAIYDHGPEFLRVHVPILPNDTPKTLGARVNAAEHKWQSEITSMVVNGEIWLDNGDPRSVVVPHGYEIDKYENENK